MAERGGKRGAQTHIGILSVDASDEVGKAMLLLVFIRDEEGVRVEITMVDLEASFVGNPVAISEGRISWRAQRQKKGLFQTRVGTEKIVMLLPLLSSATGQCVGFAPKSNFGPGDF